MTGDTPAVGRRPRARIDLLVVAAVVAGYVAFAVHFEFSERVARWGSGYEAWQLDESPLALLVLSLALSWYAFRRAGEARREIRERVRAESRIADLLAHNRELSQRLILVQENERRALARELHDEFGQDCTAIRAEASFLIHADAGDRRAVVEGAQRIADIAGKLHALVRDMLHRLRPGALDSLGLEMALQELCETWERQSGIACSFFPDAIPADLDDAQAVTVFRLVQEGLTNVACHAGADRVRIDCRVSGERLLLSIADNGRGMADTEQPRAGFGLIGMRERVAGLHGEISLCDGPGGGLRIEVSLPLEAAA